MPAFRSSSKKIKPSRNTLKRHHDAEHATKSSVTPKRKKHAGTKHDLSPVIRHEHASTFTASVNDEVKRKLDILKRSTLRPIVIYYEPADAKVPTIKWRLYPIKPNQVLPVMYIHRQSSYIIGRNTQVCDIQIRHCSCSNQHAVLQYRDLQGEVRPYMMDLKSMNGTRVNGNHITPLTYVELFENDVIEFGLSTRKYVLVHRNSECLRNESSR